ncbi:hypothetical protein [Nocardioides lijunqiniae]|uniref:hypothetical protein n=1 Tax=Nocardioides lijunqiniae TaxID=2760832 RepID=UPI0018775FCE|nr:hypothetical protein [Nocardioides lijunqiniae]
MAKKKSGSGSSSGGKGGSSGRYVEKGTPKGPITGGGAKQGGGSNPKPPKPSTGDLGPNKKGKPTP